MKNLFFVALAVFLGSCATPPEPIPVVEYQKPEIFVNSDGRRWVCIKRPIRRLDGSIQRIEEFCQ